MKKTIILAGSILLLSLTELSLYAQINLEKKVKTQTVNRANRRTDQAIGKGLDAVEKGVKDAVTGEKEEPKKEAKAENKTEAKTEKTESSTKPVNTEPTLASYSKFDFIPGEKVIFFDDFAQDAIGDFPALWNTNASGEVVTTNLFPGHWFKIMNNGAFTTLAQTELSDNFTIEFDVIPVPKASSKTGDFIFTIYADPKNNFAGGLPGDGGANIIFSSLRHFFRNYQSTNSNKDGSFINISGESTNEVLTINKKSHISIWVQKRRIRVYHEQTKLFDLPTGMPTNLKYNKFRFLIWDRPGEPLISNIRIATGLPDMRNKLLTEGKLVTYGIYFESGSDKIKPESYGTIKSIADILKENADVKIKVIGHTDADGDAAKNLDLSKRRAASVKNELVSTFGIDANRIETDGKGKTEPVAANDTPANKAQNRRVEFVKI